MTGRTTWWACDAAEHDRELIVELGEAYGPGGPYLLRVLKDLAQQQRHEGTVRTGFRSLARKVFLDATAVRKVIEEAADIGALDDLVIDEDGRRFTCRVSGWQADQSRGREAMKKALQRAGDMGGHVPPEGDKVPADGDVSPECPPTRPDQTREETTAVADPARLDDARDRLRSEQIHQVFDAWVAATSRDVARTKLTPDRRRRIEKALGSHGLEDCLTAVRHIGADAWAGGDNDRGRPFNDIEHALGTTKRLEDWRDRRPRAPKGGIAPVVAEGDRLIAEALARKAS